MFFYSYIDQFIRVTQLNNRFMKKMIWAIVLFMLQTSSILLSQSGEGAAPTVEYSPEEKAVMQVILDETADYTKMSFADLARKYWILDDKTYMCVGHLDGISFMQYKDELLARDEITPADQVKVEKSNFKVLVNGNMATIYHNQVVTILETGDKSYSHEIRTLERVNGVWKIHCSTVVQYMPH